MTENWNRKPPIIYAIAKLQELQIRLQKLTIQEQLSRAKALLELEIQKSKNGRK
jgi:hypothetical protein